MEREANHLASRIRRIGLRIAARAGCVTPGCDGLAKRPLLLATAVVHISAILLLGPLRPPSAQIVALRLYVHSQSREGGKQSVEVGSSRILLGCPIRGPALPP